MVRLGLIGSGSIGAFHAESIARRIHGAELAAVADRSVGWGAEPAEEGLDVLDEQLGLFERGKVATAIELAPVHDMVGALSEASHGSGEIGSEDGDTGGGRGVCGDGCRRRVEGLPVEAG